MGRNYGQTNEKTDDPITRCPRRTVTDWDRNKLHPLIRADLFRPGHKEDWCSVTVVLTPVHSWTLMDSWKRGVRPDAWEESVSTVCLNQPTMTARDTANVIRKLCIYYNYWIAARNNWNRTNVIIKFSRACAGHCLVYLIINCTKCWK